MTDDEISESLRKLRLYVEHPYTDSDTIVLNSMLVVLTAGDIGAALALIAAQQERLKLADEVIRPFAERRTVEEALREQGPSEWALAAPERRAELLGERKRAHDAAILAARSFTEGSLRDG